MPNRREFGRGVAAAAAGVWVAGPANVFAQRSTATTRRQITIGGRRVKTIDVHAHVTVPEAAALFAGATGGG